MEWKTLKSIFSRWPLLLACEVALATLLKERGYKVRKELRVENAQYANLATHGYTVKRKGSYLSVSKPGTGFKEIFLRYRTSDIVVFNQVFLSNEFADLLAFIPNDHKITTIIDAGANIGLSSIKFNSVFPGATVIAIEPDENNYRMMCKNLQANNVKHTALQAGVWNKTTTLYIDRSFRDGREWSIHVTEKANGEPGIRAVALSELVQKHGIPEIGLLKIDVEGSEKQIFLEPGANLDFLQKTKYIAIEVHDEVVETVKIEKVLLTNGFTLSKSGEYLIGKNSRIT
jgi:FkbM family methyltransferase